MDGESKSRKYKWSACFEDDDDDDDIDYINGKSINLSQYLNWHVSGDNRIDRHFWTISNYELKISKNIKEKIFCHLIDDEGLCITETTINLVNNNLSFIINNQYT